MASDDNSNPLNRAFIGRTKPWTILMGIIHFGISVPSLEAGNDSYGTKRYGRQCMVNSQVSFDKKAHVMVCRGVPDTTSALGSLGINNRPSISAMCFKNLANEEIFFIVGIYATNFMFVFTKSVEIGYQFDDGERFYDHWQWSGGTDPGAITTDLATVRHFLDRLQGASLLSYQIKDTTERIPLDHGASKAVNDLLSRCFEFHEESQEIAEIIYNIEPERAVAIQLPNPPSPKPPPPDPQPLSFSQKPSD